MGLQLNLSPSPIDLRQLVEVREFGAGQLVKGTDSVVNPLWEVRERFVIQLEEVME